jgi:hypothetical protein
MEGPSRIMTFARISLRFATAILGGGLLVACGRVGTLDQPAPLYGAKAKAEYQARVAAQAAATQARRENGIPDPVTEPDPIMTPALPPGAAPPPSAPAPSPQAQ